MKVMNVNSASLLFGGLYQIIFALSTSICLRHFSGGSRISRRGGVDLVGEAVDP